MRKSDKTCDVELIARIKADDELAFRVIFERYSNKLYNFSYRFLKDSDQCQEIVQDTFLNFWLNRSRLDDQYPVGPYLYTITRRLTLNALRNMANSQTAMNKLWMNVQTVSNETEEGVFADDLQKFAEEVLNRLPKQQQLIFRMSRQQELSYDEIAKELNISKNTVRNHLVAALKTLRTQLHKMLFSWVA